VISPNNYQPMTGDIFACWGRDWISLGISAEGSLTSWLTGPNNLRWSPSHVAIACCRDVPNNRQEFWFESTQLTDRHCLQAERPVAGVQCHQIRDRLRDYVAAGGRVDVYRMPQFWRFDALEMTQLRATLLAMCGRPDGSPAVSYDMGGAAFSGTRILKYLPFGQANLDSLFCSELIASCLQRFCRLNLANPARYNPGLLLRQLVRQGTYGLHTRFRKTSEVPS
jgi:hypothetical protein